MDKVSGGKIGRYEIVRVLGRGGMGEVILAQDENLGRRVAIKRPFKSAVADGLARFQVEAKAATLRHPNIPAVYEMGVHDDLPFIAMEYVEGETLEKLIDSKREIDLITKLRIIEQVSSALGYAHENGIIHRDIKPANIIVQPDGIAKIIDFGIAKLQDDDANSGLTKASQLIGSLHYIAPERFYGGKADGRVDIFSTGVTLFKLLTGKEPFTGGEATASFKILHESHSSLGASLHDYPPALDEIVEKSLAKNPDDRYQTGEDMADALHEVIEELKRTRVAELFNDAERLTTERRFAPALELLDEAIKLDPSNTQARKLRKFVREHQERIRRAERVRECLLKSDEALLNGNFDEALGQLKDAQNLDSASEEIKSKIQAVEEQKRRSDSSSRALTEAERVKARGDFTQALKLVAKALQDDPDNKKLITFNSSLARQLEIEAQRDRLLELQANATSALSARDWDTADKLLTEAAAIDPADPDTDKLRRELAKVRELEQRRAVLEEIQARVHEFIRTDAYDQASDLLNRALERLPNETMLHRLKAEVDAEARKYDVRRIVDLSISQANELFATSPLEALGVLQQALENIPGEERLVSYERALRQQLEAHRSEQLRADTVVKAREMMAAGQLDKAIGVLETFQVEFGQHPDVDGLLTFAREERARKQRADLVGRSLSEARVLVRDGRLDDAVRLLESAQQQTGDAAVSALLDEIREQQAVIARKQEALLKRVDLLRERGELDEAIQLLQEQLATAAAGASLQQLANSLIAERKRKQDTAIALRAAREAARQNDFKAALESLQTVVNAYGESAEITSAIHEVEQQRAAHAAEVVGKSIESAQAALLKKDAQGALEALKTATPHLDFADALKQAEWQRIGQSVKKALQQAGSPTGTAFDQQLTAIAQTRPRQTMLWVLGGAALVILLVIGFGVGKIVHPNLPPASIEIQNVMSGATVTIDGAARTADANGDVKVDVKAGTHRIVIARDGFRTKDKSIDIQGQYTMDGTLIEAGKRVGTLSVALLPKELESVSVAVNGVPKGQIGSNQPLELEVGTYALRFTAPGYKAQDIAGVALSDANPTQLNVTMEPQPQGTITVHLVGGAAGARMFVNGRPQPGEVHSNQKITLPEGTFSLRFESLGYKPVDLPGVKVANTADTPLNVNFEKVAGPSGTLSANQGSIQRGNSVTLTWETQNAKTLQISGIGAVPASGTRQVSPVATTTYVLLNDAQELSRVTVQVTEPLKPKVTSFLANPSSIEAGQSTTLSWNVENASSVQITGVDGAKPAQGSAVVYPKTKTTYELSVNGQMLYSLDVDVRAVPVQQQAQTRVNETPPPDRATLETVVRAAYVSVFQRASGKNTKDCQGVFNGALGGKLAGLGQWCSLAKGFSAAEQCSQVNSAGDSATLACSETVIVQPKDGDPQPIHSQKLFKFSRSADGTWQFQGW
jgi:serine/threonine-protein kinase